MDDMAGETFGKYVVIRRLAMGGMAEVCLARLQGAAGFNKLCVVKQVLPHLAEDPSFTEMFLDEGRLAARLVHPNIAQTFELGEDGGRFFMAMEFVPGKSLSDVFKRLRDLDQTMPLACAMRIELQLLEALQYAHALKGDSGKPLGLVHRDVSPSNVMVTFDGSVKLLDFGIAKAVTHSHQTESGRVKGKGGYMSPEQCRGRDLDSRSDLYAAGAVLYQLVTGVKPFDNLINGSDIYALMQATMRGGFALPSQVRAGLPAELDSIVKQAMALKPEDRYRSARPMMADLEALSGRLGTFPSAQRLAELMEQLFGEEQEELAFLPEVPEAAAADVRSSPSFVEQSQSFVEPLSFDSLLIPKAPGAVAPAREEKTRLDRPVDPDDNEQTRDVTSLGLTAFAPRTATPRKATRLPRTWLAVATIAGGAALGFGGLLLQSRLSSEVAVVVEPAPQPEAPARAPASPPPVVADAVAPPEPEPVPAPVAVAARPAAKTVEPKALVVAAKGTVQLDAYPWAYVSWKGKRLGETPMSAELPAGEQVLVIENPELKMKRQVKLLVKPNAITTHFEKFGSD